MALEDLFPQADSGSYYTPQSIETKRKLALAMMQQGLDTSPIRSGWQGAARMAQAALGGYDLYKADQEEKDAQKAQSAALGAMIGINPSTAQPGSVATAGGGTGPTPSTGAAPDKMALGHTIMKQLKDAGYTDNQAAAIAGNMVWESGGNPAAVSANDNRKIAYSPHSAGLGQWNDRLPALRDYARKNGIDVPDGDLRDANYVRNMIKAIPTETQVGFAINELQGPEARANAMIKASDDPNMIARGAISYHRPAGWTWNNPEAGHAYSQRNALGQLILKTQPQEARVADASGMTLPQPIPGVSLDNLPPAAQGAPPAAGGAPLAQPTQNPPQAAPAPNPGQIQSPQSILADNRIPAEMRQRLGVLLANPATAPLAQKVIMTSILPKLLDPKQSDVEPKNYITTDPYGNKVEKTRMFNKTTGRWADEEVPAATAGSPASPPAGAAPSFGAPAGPLNPNAARPALGPSAPDSAYQVPQAPPGVNPVEFAKTNASQVAKEQANERDKALGAIDFLRQLDMARGMVKEKGDVIGRYADPGVEGSGGGGRMGVEGSPVDVPVTRGFASAPLATTLKTFRDIAGSVPGILGPNIYEVENAKRDALDQMFTKLQQAGLKATYGSRVTNVDVNQQQKTVPHLTDTNQQVSLDKLDQLEKISIDNLKNGLRSGLISPQALNDVPPEIAKRALEGLVIHNGQGGRMIMKDGQWQNL